MLPESLGHQGPREIRRGDNMKSLVSSHVNRARLRTDGYSSINLFSMMT